MKKIFILLFSLLSISLFSQTLPNYDFEEWNNIIIYEEPANWNTPNPFTSLLGTVTVNKSNDAYTGSHSAKLETKNLMDINLPGVMTLADININLLDSSYSVTGGFFLQENIFKLTGWYKYEGVGEDMASILIYNFRNTEETGYDTIGYGYGFLENASEWTQFTVYMQNIMHNAVPDTFNVVIASSQAIGAQVGSTLWVDSLSIYTNTGIIDLWKPKTALKVYPNPAIHNISFETESRINNGILSIYNSIGEKIVDIPFADNSATFNVRDLTSGIYTYTLREKNKILNSGTFIKN
ncbi:MAG: hypothetical protein C0598_08720 [Marinilabiliales bacterium]|nr:MAG: hypothetical protein C0598_08720 [Marinilabiliales bacterium]